MEDDKNVKCSIFKFHVKHFVMDWVIIIIFK
jgi:hypothetical protein